MSGGFDDAFLAEVRERNNIVSVVGDYVSLRKAGHQQYKGLCPFHSEKSPSFHVHEDRQFFYCFGCQAGGDVITFVRELNGYSFVEAIRHLAERAGLPLPEPTRDDGLPRRGALRAARASKSERDLFYEIGGIAQRFFVETLATMEGTGCRDYLRARGIEAKAIERFGLGYAPDRWDGLTGRLREQEVPPPLAEQLGLIVPRGNGPGHYDRFRHRLTFPIRSNAGDVIAFGGRTLSTEKDVAKYVNSPDTPIYSKGDTLFGLYEARTALRREGHAIVVEGNLDLVRLSQAGLEHVVAPMGTALTAAQCRLIKRFAPRAVFLYDGDNAGRAASEKAVPIALAEGLQVAVALLPDGEDPDSFVGRHGADAMRAVLDRATPGFEHLVLRCILPRLGDVRGARESFAAAQEIAPTLELIRDPAERRLYERQLAEILGLDEAALVPLLKASPRRRPRGDAPNPSGPASQAAPAVHRPPPPQSEHELLLLMLLAPEASALYMAHDVASLVTHPGVRDAADALAQRWEAEEGLEVASFVASVGDIALRETLFKSLASAPPLGEGWPTAFEQIESRLKREGFQRRLSALKLDERRATLAGDELGALRLQMERVKVQRQLESLRASRG